jgi:hypothetical protein
MLCQRQMGDALPNAALYRNTIQIYKRLSLLENE